MHGCCVFLILNIVVLPVAGLGTITEVFQLLHRTEIDEWNIAIGRLFVNTSGSFMIRYLMNGCFLSSSWQLLQLGQLSYRSISSQLGKFHKPFAFDFGYWYAVCLAVFTMILAFSVLLPLVVPFGCLFFGLKYLVDKHNFLFGMWRADVESGGAIAITARYYIIFAIAFMQFCMSGYFLAVGGRNLTLAATLLVIVSLMTVVLLLSHSLFLRHTFPSTAANQTTSTIPREKLAALKHAYRHPCERAIARRARRKMIREHYAKYFESS